MSAKKGKKKHPPQPGRTDVASLKLEHSDAHGTRWVFTQPAERSQVHSTIRRKARPAEHAGSTSTSTEHKLGFVEAPSPGQCVGTLRWGDSSRFPPLPAWPASLVGDEVPAPEGWRDYLAMRLLRLRPPSHERLTLLIVGSSSKAEARLLRDSNCAQ